MTFNITKYNEDKEYKKVINSLIESKIKGYNHDLKYKTWEIIRKGTKFYVKVIRENETVEREINSLLRNV